MKPTGEINVLAFASEKGGVGKSTAAAGVALSLARRGKTVLLADLDAAVHSADLLFGMEDRALFGLSDLLSGKSEGVLLSVCERLFLCPAPDDFECLASPDAAETLLRAASQSDADYLLLDMPSKTPAAWDFALSCASSFFVVSGQDKASVLAAEITAQRIVGQDKPCFLLLNRFDLNDMPSYKTERDSVRQIIDLAHIPLLGIVPECYALLRDAEAGTLADTGEYTVYFDNIAARIEKEELPLFDGTENGRKIRKYL